MAKQFLVSAERVRRFNPFGKITAGKKYLATLLNDSEKSFTITSDGGPTLYCTLENCSHLCGENWIKEELPDEKTKNIGTPAQP